MTVFRIIVGTLLITLLAYTAVTVSRVGTDFMTPFLAELAVMHWQGQFNLDFASYLALTTCWHLWRNEGSVIAWVTAPLIAIGGMLVFAIYLLWLSFRVDGRLDVLMIGKGRVNALAQRATAA